MKINLPETGKPRVVIVGAGFAGLTLANRLARTRQYQIVVLDKNNYHQFQPLFYQVAMSGLEPSSISFPLRKFFQGRNGVYLRTTEVTSIEPENKRLQTPLGIVNYDYLVLATGAQTNFFGNQEISEKAIPMKSVSEALFLRNRILEDYEQALTVTDYDERQTYLDIVIAGGGPTGVELAGAFAEMKKYILPKDFPELNAN
ncbi:MAG: FAD-dependent oxidoreductase, partial [Haliscomenobacter sp.]|nr:FAD-dependent oxidoreductase [Haliscomenobacter sp.]